MCAESHIARVMERHLQHLRGVDLLHAQIDSTTLSLEYLYTCKARAMYAEFHGERVVERHLRRLGGVDLLHAQIDSAIRTGRQASLDLFLHKYGEPQQHLLLIVVQQSDSEQPHMGLWGVQQYAPLLLVCATSLLSS